MKRGVRAALAASGWSATRLRRARWPGVVVVCYHGLRSSTAVSLPFGSLHVTRDQFERHCRIYATLCHPIALAEWRAHRERGRALPPRPVLVTFDDGYRSVAEFALPVLERYGVPAALFLCTGPIATGERFWFDAVAVAQGEEAAMRLKQAPYEQWRDITAGLRQRASLHDPHAPLDAARVRQLAAHPLLEFGTHTVTHPILARAPRAVQRAEIRESIDAITRWTGRDVLAFAYPNGGTGDFNDETLAELAEAGIRDAFTTQPSLARSRSDRLRLPRLVAVDGWSEDWLLWRLGGVSAG